MNATTLKRAMELQDEREDLTAALEQWERKERRPDSSAGDLWYAVPEAAFKVMRRATIDDLLTRLAANRAEFEKL